MKRGPMGLAAAVGSRRGGRLALEGPWTCHGVPAGDYKPWAALIGTCVFSAKAKMARKSYFLLVLLQLAKWLCPFKLYQNYLQGGVVDSKSYFANAETHHDEASQVTGLTPDPTTCDTETSEPDPPPSGSRPPGVT